MLTGLGHVVVDLGDDEFTVGPPAPDDRPDRCGSTCWPSRPPTPTWRWCCSTSCSDTPPTPTRPRGSRRRSAMRSRTAADGGRHLSVVVALCGTGGDPQDREAQADALVAAGAWVFASNAAAARAAAGLADRTRADPVRRQPCRRGSRNRSRPLGRPTAGPPTAPAAGSGSRPDRRFPICRSDRARAVICAGIDLLADALRGQAVDVVTVDYRPTAFDTADADAVPAALRAVLADPRRRPANALAARADARRPGAAGRRPAGLARRSGCGPGEFCHAGPPIDFDRASGPLRGALIGAMIFEGLAADEADADRETVGGEGISLGPCHDRHAVGPMAGRDLAVDVAVRAAPTRRPARGPGAR